MMADNKLNIITIIIVVFFPLIKGLFPVFKLKVHLREIYRFIPARIVHFRVFTMTHDHDAEVTMAAESVLDNPRTTSRTNI